MTKKNGMLEVAATMKRVLSDRIDSFATTPTEKRSGGGGAPGVPLAFIIIGGPGAFEIMLALRERISDFRGTPVEYASQAIRVEPDAPPTPNVN